MATWTADRSCLLPPHSRLCPQEEYTAEGLEWSTVSYQDNQTCLDLIEGSPISICSLINEVGGSARVQNTRVGLWASLGP